MKKPKRILVALKSTEQAIELTDIACRLAAQGASLWIVNVIELPPATPLDAPVKDLEDDAKLILKTAERVAKSSRLKVTKLVLRAHWAGDALLDEIKEKKIELAILGYHHRRSFEEVLLGTVAQHVSKNAPCNVLLRIPPKK